MKIGEKFSFLLYSNRFLSKPVLNYIYYMIEYDKDNISTFKIDYMPILKEIQGLLKSSTYYNALYNGRYNEYSDYDNGVIGMFEVYNERFIEELLL